MTTSTDLKSTMTAHGLTPGKVAELVGVSVYTVLAWKYGQRAMPDNLYELLQLKLNAPQQEE